MEPLITRSPNFQNYANDIGNLFKNSIIDTLKRLIQSSFIDISLKQYGRNNRLLLIN